MYLRNRWYDPQTGRFLSQDPIGLAGGVNLYAYAGNNPTTFSDPFGLECKPPDSPVCQFINGVAGRVAPLERTVNRVGEATGLRDLVEGVDALSDGRVISGGVSLAMALPASREAKAGKVVIGETMERVISHARRIGGNWYKARGTNPANWMRNNMQWLRRQMNQGKEVVDIGTDATRANRSVHYQAEKKLLERYNYPVTRDPQP